EAVTEVAAAVLAGQAPRVSFVYLGAVDFAGHATGSGAVCRAARRAADEGVGRLVATVRARPSGPAEDWTIVVVTDHGHLDEGGHGGGGPAGPAAGGAPPRARPRARHRVRRPRGPGHPPGRPAADHPAGGGVAAGSGCSGLPSASRVSAQA